MGIDDEAMHPDQLALDLYAAVLDGTPMVGVVDAIRRAVGADSAWISRIGFVGRPGLPRRACRRRLT